ncbi:unnamed protein product [Cyprideis torosa]|uniref:Uncharacterized protein n=1 Tax=Cyprideis torosa TaxID=163714 RepID=A0A7R8W807_9CRUS|nr:unnamed protein product [Cyprideis torosa]CAG0888097.1 unnamed protein product [Cyprideis torosa]
MEPVILVTILVQVLNLGTLGRSEASPWYYNRLPRYPYRYAPMYPHGDSSSDSEDVWYSPRYRHPKYSVVSSPKFKQIQKPSEGHSIRKIYTVRPKPTSAFRKVKFIETAPKTEPAKTSKFPMTPLKDSFGYRKIHQSHSIYYSPKPGYFIRLPVEFKNKESKTDSEINNETINGVSVTKAKGSTHETRKNDEGKPERTHSVRISWKAPKPTEEPPQRRMVFQYHRQPWKPETRNELRSKSPSYNQETKGPMEEPDSGKGPDAVQQQEATAAEGSQMAEQVDTEPLTDPEGIHQEIQAAAQKEPVDHSQSAYHTTSPQLEPATDSSHQGTSNALDLQTHLPAQEQAEPEQAQPQPEPTAQVQTGVPDLTSNIQSVDQEFPAFAHAERLTGLREQIDHIRQQIYSKTGIPHSSGQTQMEVNQAFSPTPVETMEPQEPEPSAFDVQQETASPYLHPVVAPQANEYLESFSNLQSLQHETPSFMGSHAHASTGQELPGGAGEPATSLQEISKQVTPSEQTQGPSEPGAPEDFTPEEIEFLADLLLEKLNSLPPTGESLGIQVPPAAAL